MNYGLYLSASGVLTNMYRQDVIANNLANANTAGFKRALAAFSQRDPEAIEDSLAAGAQPLLDRIGGGVFAHRSPVDFTPGALDKTGNDLDVAIEGEGFFALRTRDEQGQAAIRLSRDGRFTVDRAGQLVTTAGGHAVLDGNDQPILLDRGRPVRIDSAGTIRQGGSMVARLPVWNVPDAQKLEQRGGGLLEATPADLDRRQRSEAPLQQGWVEQSNVDPVREMTQLIEATRAMANGANLIRYHDSLLHSAVSTLGRVIA